MSLKAKIEAVIYASEEPVTLAQLVGLLGQEAQGELDRDVAQQTLALSEVEAEAATEQPELGHDFAGDEVSAALVEPSETAVGVQPTHGDDAAMNGASDLVDEAGAAAAAAAAAARAEKARVARLRAHFRAVLDELLADYATSERGLEIREVGGGFRLATKPEYHDAVRGFVKSLKPPLKLTLQALETLAVVAYKQPVTAPEISEIRGVDSSGVLGSLIARKLITTAGRKQVIGRPILYKTTKDFLLKFGLKDVAELPSIEEFEKMAGQMAEQEEIPMSEPEHSAPESAEELEPERDAYAPQADGDSASADNVAPEDKAGIDGRISSLPPDYDDEADDPSAQEAEIQKDEQ
jgi:segregation and condensation protein B